MSEIGTGMELLASCRHVVRRFRLRHQRALVLGLTALAVVLVLGGCSDNPVGPEEGLPLGDSYIVVFADSAIDAASVADEFANAYDIDLTFVYTGAVKGFAGSIPREHVSKIEADERVAYVTPDKPVEVKPEEHALYSPSVGTQVLPWGVDSVQADISSTRAGNGSGEVSGVHIYIIDTGIASHPDLNLVQHVNFATGENTDCNGHGTHVAGTAAARDNSQGVVGVAPGAQLYGVKVLDCNGSGTTSAIVKGLNWVIANARRPAVVNMSLGTPMHAVAFHDAVTAAINSGITTVIAAGNANVNSSSTEPAHVAAAITVGASDQQNCKASFSNWGSVLDIFAPGVGIASTYLDGGYAILGGTSMAAPHVTGGAALFLSRLPNATPTRVRSAMVNTASQNVDCGFSTSQHNTATVPHRLTATRL